MKSIREMTQAELVAFVQSHLSERGINVVLSGGALSSARAPRFYHAGMFLPLDGFSI